MMFAKILASRLLGPIAAGLALLFGVGFVWQTVRIDGFPLLGPGLRGTLAECRNVNAEAARQRDEQIAKAREEGRAAAALDAARLVERQDERAKGLEDTVAALRADVMKLRPQTIILPGELPIVVTPPTPPPPLPAECRLDQGALDSIRATLNAGRSR